MTRHGDPNQVDPDRNVPFYEHVPLESMSADQWESLCDGCGRCCLVRLEDESTGATLETCVACRLLDPQTGRCSDYTNRFAKVPGCLQMTPERARRLGWLPETCAYRRVARGLPLPDWHPLRTGDPESVHRDGPGVAGSVISERDVHEDDLELFVTDRLDDADLTEWST